MLALAWSVRGTRTSLGRCDLHFRQTHTHFLSFYASSHGSPCAAMRPDFPLLERETDMDSLRETSWHQKAYEDGFNRKRHKVRWKRDKSLHSKQGDEKDLPRRKLKRYSARKRPESLLVKSHPAWIVLSAQSCIVSIAKIARRESVCACARENCELYKTLERYLN